MTRARAAFAISPIAGGGLGAPGACGQEGGFYLGGSLGQATFKEFCVDSPVVLRTEQETPASASGTTTCEETEFHYGLGARFAFTPNWVASAEWERTDKTKVEMLSIGLEFRF